MGVKRPLLAFFGHHKCASSWADAICADVCRELGLQHGIIYESRDVNHDVAGRVVREGIEFLAYANAEQEQVDRFPEFCGLHLVRDPRDIVVSAYFSHLKTHPTHAWPELLEYREKLQTVDEEEGLLLEMKFREQQFEQMRAWNYEQSNVLELRMEDASAAPYETFLRVFEFLGLLDPEEFTPAKRLRHVAAKAARRIESATGKRLRVPVGIDFLPAERVLGIVWEHQFAKKAKGRVKGQEDRGSHYRKGTPGDWRNHFTDRHVAAFKEQYNDLLVKLGYEKSCDW